MSRIATKSSVVPQTTASFGVALSWQQERAKAGQVQ